MDKYVGKCANSFGIDCVGDLFHSGTRKSGFGPGGFTCGDTIGCGLMTAQHEALQTNRWIFFTKNGEFWGKNTSFLNLKIF